MKIKILFLFLILFSIKTFSQQRYELNLQKSIEIAMEQSFDMKILNLNLERSKYNLEAATRQFRTKMTLDFGGPEYSQTIGDYEDSTGIHYFQTNGLYFDGAFTINQRLPTDGSIFIRSGIYSTNDFRKDNNNMKLGTTINFRQPIQALYSYNQIRSEFKRAKLSFEAAEKSKIREELNLVYNVSQVFYGLLGAQQRMEIALQALKRQQDAYDIAKNKYAAGLIREVEALQIEVDLGQSKNDYDLSIANYKSQSNLFKQSLGLSLNDSVTLQSELHYGIVHIDIEKAITHGLENRLEIREREIDIELNNINLKQQKSEGLISGEIVAHYGFSGVNEHGLPVAFSTALNETYNNLLISPDDYTVGINVHIPIIDWGENRSRVKAIQATQQMNTLRLDEEKISIEREIRNNIGQLQSALRRLQLLEKNIELSQKSFEISEYRFQNGDIDSEAFALDRERLNRTKLSHLEAYISYKLLIADLMRKTYYDFEKDQPVF